MAITMNMSSYEIERDSSAGEVYGDEVMYAEWNPQLAQVLALPTRKPDRHVAVSNEIARVDIEHFLQKMYVHQR